jgi:predicted transcriptional regulator
LASRYISLQEATKKLEVARGTFDYYLRHLEIKRKRFPLDKRSYIRLEDFERIMRYKEEAAERAKQSTDPKLPAVSKDAA